MLNIILSVMQSVLRVLLRTILAVTLFLTVAQTHSFERFQRLLIHGTDLSLLNLLFIFEHGFGYPEGSISKQQDREENEERMLDDRLAMLLKHDEEDHEE